jgi:putative transposase
MSGTYVYLRFHLVWSTKEHRPWLDALRQPRLFEYMGGTLNHRQGMLLIAGSTADHVHLLVSLSQKLAVADAVNAIKAYSSRWIHETIEGASKFAWQEGYGAFTISKSSEDRVRRYIAGQQRHHARTDFKTEFISLLEKHEIEYDPKYIWD